ncbi:MAG: threonine synthase [Acidimicrobiaceae bacterium]|jgi:threonine synthase|nr:threonine synthase [Acidimicrobiaceae bacterium]|tara:strand:- start:4424 stop:5680 length:1257 start_codon:yes stop_codon:yes gene_type:complete
MSDVTDFSNITEDRPSFVTHLECSATGDHYEPDFLQGLSDTGKPLLVRYDLEALAAALDREKLASRPSGLWRYREFLPVRRASSIVSLGETATPLVRLKGTEVRTGSSLVVVKDEGRLPTGSFKARGIALAVAMAKELGVERLAMPTNGNAGAALAAYGSRAGIDTFVFCPEDTPEVNVREIALQGARVWRVNGLINDCGRIVAEGAGPMGWFDVSTLKEPYRIEGKKTMGLELVEQFGWQAPDVIFYPTGGGTGLIGMWKVFHELKEIGWLGDLPRMVAVQATGCAPIVRAWETGAEHAEGWENASTLASGIRVPVAIGDFLMLRAVRESEGFAMAVTDEEIVASQEQVPVDDGLLLCPEGAATHAAYLQALEAGLVDTSDRVVLFNCGSGLKYPMPPMEANLDCQAPIDWSAIAGV